MYFRNVERSCKYIRRHINDQWYSIRFRDVIKLDSLNNEILSDYSRWGYCLEFLYYYLVTVNCFVCTIVNIRRIGIQVPSRWVRNFRVFRCWWQDQIHFAILGRFFRRFGRPRASKIEFTLKYKKLSTFIFR